MYGRYFEARFRRRDRIRRLLYDCCVQLARAGESLAALILGELVAARLVSCPADPGHGAGPRRQERTFVER